MATALETLVIKLQADNKEFQAGIRDVEKRLKSFEGNVKKSTDKAEKAFKGVGRAVKTMGASLAAMASVAGFRALQNLTKDALEFADEIAKTADAIGISTDVLQEFRFVARRTGVEQNTLNKALANLLLRARDAAGGSKEMLESFQDLGIELEDIQKHGGNAKEMFFLLADGAKEFSEKGNLTAVIMELLGARAKSLVIPLKQGSEGMREIIDEFDDLGGPIAEKVLRRAEALNDKWEDMQQRIQLQLIPILIQVAPHFVELTGLLGTLVIGIVDFATSLGLLEARTDTLKIKLLREELSGLMDDLDEIDDQSGPVGGQMFGAGLTPAGLGKEAIEAEIARVRDEIIKLQKEMNATEVVSKDLNSALGDMAANLNDTATAAEKAKKKLEAAFAAERKKEAGELVKEIRKLDDALLEVQDSMDAMNRTLDAEIAAFNAAIDSGASYEQAMEAVADASARAAYEQKLFNKGIEEGSNAHQNALGHYDAYVKKTKEFEGATDDVKDAQDELGKGAINLIGIFDQVFDGIIAGTLDLEDVFKSAGIALAKEFGQSFLFGKKDSFDLPFKANILGLVGPNGIIGDIFGLGGASSGKSFFGQFFAQSPVASTSTGALQAPPALKAAPSAQQKWETGGWGAISGRDWAGTAAGIAGGGAFGYGAGLAFVDTVGGNAQSTGAKIGGAAGTAVGAAIGGYFGGPEGAKLGAMIGSFFGTTLGGLIDQGPQRISVDKSDIRDFLEEGLSLPVAGGGSSRFRGASEVSFARQQNALHVLGADFGDLNDPISDVIGTMKRFGNQTQLSFEMAGLSMEQANAKTLSLASAMGVDLATSISNVNKFIEEINFAVFQEELEETSESGLDLIRVADLLTGAIDLATGFSEFIDSAAVANKHLALTIREVVGDGEEFDEVLQQLTDGTIGFEEAVNQLGLSEFDFRIDAGALQTVIADALQLIEAAAGAFGKALSDGISAGLEGEDVKAATIESFTKLMKEVLAATVIAEFIEDNLADLFAGIDFTEGITPDQIAALANVAGDLADELFKILGDLGLLPDGFDAATDSASGLLAQIEAIDTTIANIVRSMAEIQLSLIQNLGSIGVLSGEALTRASEIPLLTGLDSFFNRFNAEFREFTPSGQVIPGSHVLGGRTGTMTLADMSAAISDLDRLAGLTVQRFQQQQQMIQANLAADIAGLQTTAQLETTQAQKRIENLQEESRLEQELFASTIQGLQEELALAQAFANLADGLQTQIDTLIGGPGGLSGTQQFDYLQNRAADLRAQLHGATGQSRIDITNELSGVLQQLLGTGVFQASSDAQKDLFNNIIFELEELRDSAAVLGEQTVTIEQQILDVELAAKNALLDIERRIQDEQQIITDIGITLTSNIQQLERAATDAINQARAAADFRLREIASLQSSIAAVALAEQENQRRLLQAQLAEMGLSSDIEIANITVLNNLNTTLGNLNRFLAGVTPAAHGFSGVVTQPSLFLAGERGPERVEIGGAGSGGAAFDLSGMAVTIQGSGGDPTADGTAFGHALGTMLVEEYRSGQLGSEIREDIRRG